MTDPATPRLFEIRGGAGPYEVAAIVAAVNRVLAEDAARAVPARPPARHPWVLAGLARPELAPHPQATRIRLGWAFLAPSNGFQEET